MECSTTDHQHQRLSRIFSSFAAIRQNESPLYCRLSRIVAADSELMSPLDVVPTDPQLPTRYFAAIHYLLLGGADHAIRSVYLDPGSGLPNDRVLASRLRSFVAEHRGEISHLVATRRTQTNEVNRVAVIVPALRVAAQLAGTPLALIDVGTSAGLNLRFDHFRCCYSSGHRLGDPLSLVRLGCELRGELVPPLGPAPEVPARIGIDIAPVDVDDEDQVRWLCACVFPDQPERITRLRGAIEVARANPIPVVTGDAIETLPEILAGISGELTPVIMHTWVLAYLSPKARADFAAQLVELARQRPLLWIGAEWPENIPGRRRQDADQETVWFLASLHSGDARWFTLASSHDHGTWLQWRSKEPGCATG